MNTKEKNELLLKLMLVLVRDRQAMQGRIRSVGYTREYGELPSDMGVFTLSKMQEDEIVALADSIGIRKIRPVGAKSDIYLNDVGYAICNLTQDQPVFVDGLTRGQLSSVCGMVNVSMEHLDKCMDEYWRLRTKGVIGEHFSFNDPTSPITRKDREWLAPILSYLIFEGAESGPSLFPAECLFDYTDPLNTETWSIYEPDETIDHIWDKLVLSIREVPAPTEQVGEAGAGADQQADREDEWSSPANGILRAGLYIHYSQ